MPATISNQGPARYTDRAGHEHHVIARRTRHGRWQVLDVFVVETLTGYDDGPATAQALAHDYATQQDHPTRQRRLAA